MRDRLRTLLEIKSGEESMVSMLLTQSVFLGIFIGAFDITAYSLLLSVFDEKMLARGYVILRNARHYSYNNLFKAPCQNSIQRICNY